MSKLPKISGKKAVTAFSRAGWIISRQKSSHMIMTKSDSIVILSVPLHDELDRGTLRGLIGPGWIDCRRVRGAFMNDFSQIEKKPFSIGINLFSPSSPPCELASITGAP
jgi:predicted RNA binding protein YcfA (HicA-like mRNA interferase family)